jgi:NAD(P)-dependent dehydrogenase (short-subunit alcohol dehydrogenase family)
MDLGLAGRGVLVAGGSKGIGAVIARAFAQEGAQVAIGARRRADLEAMAKQLATETSARVLPIVLDVTDSKSAQAFVEEAKRAFGRVDVLVNCAVDVVGGGAGTPSDIPPDLLAEGINVKVLGALRMVQAALPSMRERRWGRIISLGGGAARQAGGVSAGVRNAALVAVTKNLALQVGRDGVTANVIHPGGVLTERNRPQIEARAAREGVSFEEAEARQAADVPLGRMVHPEDIAALALFLASPLAEAITGQAIGVDGGATRAIVY